MGGFRNFAISFTIISILAGCLTSYFVALRARRPDVAVTWGWLLVGPHERRSSRSRWPRSRPPIRPRAASTTGPRSSGARAGAGRPAGSTSSARSRSRPRSGTASRLFAPVLFDYWFSYTTHMDDWFGASANMSIYILYAVFLLAACLINVLEHPDHVGAQHDLGVVAHGRGRRSSSGVLIIVPDQHQSLATSSRRPSTTPGTETAWTTFAQPDVLVRASGSGCCCPQYTITGFDASAHTAEETHNASRGAAVGMWTSVVVSVIFGWILLLAVTFAIPSTEGALENIGTRRPLDLGRVDEPELGRGAAVHLRRRAVLLRHRVGDVGVADDVRVLARPRGARPPALAARRDGTACPCGRSSASGSSRLS